MEIGTADVALKPCPFCGEQIKPPSARQASFDVSEGFVAFAVCYCGGHASTAHQMGRGKTEAEAIANAIDLWNRRARPQAELAQQQASCKVSPSTVQLWAVHAQGPDDLYAAFSKEDAQAHAEALNALPMPEWIEIAAVVVPSPWGDAEHWKYLAEQERERVRVWCAGRQSAGHQTEQNAWISISDGLPDEDGPYWCWHGGEKPGATQQRVCIFIERHKEFCDANVTHWMPLPAAPARSVQEDC